MLRRLRFRPVGLIAAAATLAAMGATLVVATPGGAAPGPDKVYEAHFEISCVLAPGVLNQKGIVKVSSRGEGPESISEGEQFKLHNSTLTLVTPKEWGESFFALGSRSAKGFVTAAGLNAENGTPAFLNNAKPPEFPTGLPIKTKVESKEVEIVVPSEGRTFVAGPWTATGAAGARLNLVVDTSAGFKETTSGHFEATGEGLTSEATGFNENGEANVGPVTIACTAPSGIVEANPLITPATSTSSSTSTTTSTTTSSSTTTSHTTTTSSTTTSATTSSGGLKVKLNDKLSGFLRVKKLENQKITLPEGCTFIGEGEIPGPFEANTACPPFSAKLRILGLPSTLGTEFVESGPVKGTITPQENGKLLIKGTANDNIKINSLGLLGLSLPVSCQTATPAVFPLSAEATATELLTTGATSSGTTTLPAVHCGGFLGGVVGSLITVLMAGPNNEFQFTIHP